MIWPDGAIVGVEQGLCYRIFRPRWWEAWRWLNWLLFERRPRGTVTFTLDDGRKLTSRVVMSDWAERNPPTPTLDFRPRSRVVVHRVDGGTTEPR